MKREDTGKIDNGRQIRHDLYSRDNPRPVAIADKLFVVRQ
jgi:hypothetical protein